MRHWEGKREGERWGRNGGERGSEVGLVRKEKSGNSARERMFGRSTCCTYLLEAWRGVSDGVNHGPLHCGCKDVGIVG